MENSCQVETHYAMSLTWKSFLLPPPHIHQPTHPAWSLSIFPHDMFSDISMFCNRDESSIPFLHTAKYILNKTTKIFLSSRICTPHNSSKTCSNHRIGEVGQKFSCRGRKHFWSCFFKNWIFDIQISIVLEYLDLPDEMQRWHKAPNGTSYGLHWRWFDRFLYLQKFRSNKIFCQKNTIISDDKIILINGSSYFV